MSVQVTDTIVTSKGAQLDYQYYVYRDGQTVRENYYNFNYSGQGFTPQDSKQFTDRSMSHGFNLEYRRVITDRLRVRPGVALTREYRRTGANDARQQHLEMDRRRHRGPAGGPLRLRHHVAGGALLLQGARTRV